jgi:carboxymethylenebutenolidase
VKTYQYDDAKKDADWVLSADENYHKQSAGIAHTRSLGFLKKLLDGPWFDLEAIWEEHTKYEFEERDVEKTMATMVDDPYVNHIPTMTYVSPSFWIYIMLLQRDLILTSRKPVAV